MKAVNIGLNFVFILQERTFKNCKKILGKYHYKHRLDYSVHFKLGTEANYGFRYPR